MSDLQPGSKRTHQHGQDLAGIYRMATRSWASCMHMAYSAVYGLNIVRATSKGPLGARL